MTLRAWVAIALLVLGGTSAAAATRAAPARASAAAHGARPGQKVAKKGPVPARRAGVAKDTTVAPTRPGAAPRKLEDIHIEGEIPAPQVLFVTARDQRRFTRFHHQRYVKTALQVGEETPLPTTIATTRGPAKPTTAP